jgi:citrate synthase
VEVLGETSVGGSTVERIMVQGLDLSAEVIGKANLGDMLYLLVARRLPSAEESVVFNAVLVSIADHGITPNSLAARLAYTGAPEALQGAVAAGLLGIGGVILGVAEDAARLMQEGVARASSLDDAALAEAIEAVLDEVPAGTRLPGVGHPIHKAGDPRLDVLLGLARQHGQFGPHCRMFEIYGERANKRLGLELPLNAAGASGAILSDLGFSWKIVRGLMLVARAAGMVGHLAEEQEHPIGWDVWRAIEQRVPYRPPAPQPVAP